MKKTEIQATKTPTQAPPIMSYQKCTPARTRATPVRIAKAKSTIPARLSKVYIAYASANINVACPEGKLYGSFGIKSAWVRSGRG